MSSVDVYDKKYYKDRVDYESRTDRIRKFYKAIKKCNPDVVLDVGCGHGFLVKYLRKKKLDAYGLDWSFYAGDEIEEYFFQADAKNTPFADEVFDVVFSADFFEHIEEKEIEDVLNEMNRIGRKVVAKISYKPQKPYHLTVKPKKWWERKLKGVQLL